MTAETLLPPKPRLIGVLTPSANTVVERTTQAMLHDIPEAAALFTRIPVHGDSDPYPDSYHPAMLDAARLLAHAKPDAIVWIGSKGGAIGLQHDRDLIERIQAATGIPAHSSGLALLHAIRVSGARQFGLITPYPAGYQRRLVGQLALDGVNIVAESHLGLTDNLSYASVSYAEILEQARLIARSKPDVILAWCTNYAAAPLAATIEAETGIPLWDATALGVFGGLWRAGVATRPLGWGRLAGLV